MLGSFASQFMRNYKGPFGSLRLVAPLQMFKLVEAFKDDQFFNKISHYPLSVTRVNTVLLSNQVDSFLSEQLQ